MLRLAVLTTDTPHHRYFLRRLVEDKPAGVVIAANLFETRSYPWRLRARRHFVRSLPNLWQGLVRNPYLQSRRFAERQVRFEGEAFFPSGDNGLPDSFPSRASASANDPDAIDWLKRGEPDLLLVYGTGRLKPAVFSWLRLGAINAHGGLLPRYRGLDTNLWAAYEGRPEDMAVTIHQIDAELDTGAIYAMQRLGPIRGLNLLNLRYYTALLSTELFVEVLHRLVSGDAKAEPQLQGGQYYGPMPMWLKVRTNRILRSYAGA